MGGVDDRVGVFFLHGLSRCCEGWGQGPKALWWARFEAEDILPVEIQETVWGGDIALFLNLLLFLLPVFV